jgi:hypothetical protein
VPKDQREDAQKLLEPAQEQAEVVAGSGEHLDAAEQMAAFARQWTGDDTPTPPASVIAKLHEATAITASLGLSRSACRELVESEFLIRLTLQLDSIEADGVSELIQATRAALATALVQQ